MKELPCDILPFFGAFRERLRKYIDMVKVSGMPFNGDVESYVDDIMTNLCLGFPSVIVENSMTVSPSKDSVVNVLRTLSVEIGKKVEGTPEQDEYSIPVLQLVDLAREISELKD